MKHSHIVVLMHGQPDKAKIILDEWKGRAFYKFNYRFIFPVEFTVPEKDKAKMLKDIASFYPYNLERHPNFKYTLFSVFMKIFMRLFGLSPLSSQRQIGLRNEWDVQHSEEIFYAQSMFYPFWHCLDWMQFIPLGELKDVD